MIQGQCNCGSVAFEILTPLTDIYACHCSICRRFSGSNGVAVVVVRNEAFAWLRGESLVRVWSKPDADWQANFCSTCGSALPGRNDDERMFIPAGLLPGDLDGLEIRHHIFVGSKAHWDRIGDTGIQHPGSIST